VEGLTNIPRPSGLICTLQELFVSFDMMTTIIDARNKGDYSALDLSVLSMSKTTNAEHAGYRIVGTRETRPCLVLVQKPETRSGPSICAAPAT
jgi:hypothetical protein